MMIQHNYLEISFDDAGIRNSQKRLKGLISELAVEPLRAYQDDLTGEFDAVEEIVLKRIANVIAYWSEHKHDPIAPKSSDKMSDITNTSTGKNDPTLEEFYIDQVQNAMHVLAPTFRLDVPQGYMPHTDELEFALLELEENFDPHGKSSGAGSSSAASTQFDTMDDFDNMMNDEDDDIDADIPDQPERSQPQQPARRSRQATPETAIISAAEHHIVEVEPQQVQMNSVNIGTEDAWRMIYSMLGYESEYIQQTMLPRWQQYPDSFQTDRQFLYRMFIEAIQHSAGAQVIAGNFHFADQRLTIDQLWQYYFSDLSQKIAPQLTAAKLHAAANDPWWKKMRQNLMGDIRNISPIWLLALAIALVFDGLTTYISLDQTPMEGIIVPIFTVLITALFQIADQLVINYRKREFEADALIAKFKAQYERRNSALENLDTASESYVQMSMERSKAQADWKAAEDNRKMARRGRFWSARIADINVIVTAYGFAYLFLNAEEPVYALIQQIDYIFVQGVWENVDLWVFLMVGLAITVSFVVNTAQRTEILGWSMRRLKREG